MRKGIFILLLMVKVPCYGINHKTIVNWIENLTIKEKRELREILEIQESLITAYLDLKTHEKTLDNKSIKASEFKMQDLVINQQKLMDKLDDQTTKKFSELSDKWECYELNRELKFIYDLEKEL